jgi:hypothetical protein
MCRFAMCLLLVWFSFLFSGSSGFTQEGPVRLVNPPKEDLESMVPPSLPPQDYKEILPPPRLSEPVYRTETNNSFPVTVWSQYRDVRGRFVINYDSSEPRVNLDLLVKRFQTALELNLSEDQMGSTEIVEPIQVFIGKMKLEVPGREVKDTTLAAVTAIESSHIVIKAPPEDASVTTFCHELAHWRMMRENFVNVPYWLSEGISHYYEEQGGYNHNMYRWLQYESPLTLERIVDAHSSSQDSMRRRATGWLLVYYYKQNGESWQQICRRDKFADPIRIWAWMKDHFQERDLKTQIGNLEKIGKKVPAELSASLAEIQDRLAKFKD